MSSLNPELRGMISRAETDRSIAREEWEARQRVLEEQARLRAEQERTLTQEREQERLRHESDPAVIEERRQARMRQEIADALNDAYRLHDRTTPQLARSVAKLALQEEVTQNIVVGRRPVVQLGRFVVDHTGWILKQQYHSIDVAEEAETLPGTSGHFLTPDGDIYEYYFYGYRPNRGWRPHSHTVFAGWETYEDGVELGFDDGAQKYSSRRVYSTYEDRCERVTLRGGDKPADPNNLPPLAEIERTLTESPPLNEYDRLLLGFAEKHNFLNQIA